MTRCPPRIPDGDSMIHAYGEDPDVYAFLEMDDLDFCQASPPALAPQSHCLSCGCGYEAGFFLLDFYPHRRRIQQSRIVEFDIRGFHSSRALISPKAEISGGAIILPNSYIGEGAVVGFACKIGIGAQVHHGAVLEDFVTIAPGAIVLGGARVSEGSIMGAGSILRQGRRVGPGAYVGMGSVVVADIGDSVIAYGNPARGIRTYYQHSTSP